MLYKYPLDYSSQQPKKLGTIIISIQIKGEPLRGSYSVNYRVDPNLGSLTSVLELLTICCTKDSNIRGREREQWALNPISLRFNLGLSISHYYRCEVCIWLRI